MRVKPGAIVPLSETRWILTAIRSAHSRLEDEVICLEEVDDSSVSYLSELENMRQDRDELGYAGDLLEKRLQEALTGEEPAPAQPEFVRTPG